MENRKFLDQGILIEEKEMNFLDRLLIKKYFLVCKKYWNVC